MKIDPTKTATANLLALLSEVNPSKTFTTAKVTFGSATAYTDPQGVTNSRIAVNAVKNAGYSGSQLITYKRCTFAQAYPTFPTTFAVAGTDTVADVTSRITTALSTLVSEFIINAGTAITLPTATNQSVSVTIAAKSTSNIFLPTVSITITLQFTLPIINVTSATSGNNLNTLTLLGTTTAIADYRLTITGTIGSTSTANPALTVGALPTGSKMTIINKGTIQGCGGAGGAYNANGSPGGPAIKALMNCSLDTSAGFIFGGGGGGGGCNQSWPGIIGLGAGYIRAAGGGGAGNAGGAIGTGTAVMTVGAVNSQPVAGTSSTGGAGAVCTNASNTTQNSKGGAGGAPGAAGTAGVATYGTAGSTTIANFTGGAAGKAIDLNGFTVTITAGNNATQIKGLAA